MPQPVFRPRCSRRRIVSAGVPRIAELPQWEQLGQIGSDIRQHTLENMDVYLARFMVAPIFSKTSLVVMCLSVFVVGITEILNSQGAELVSSNADKYDMARCGLGITEADFLLPETAVLVLRSSPWLCSYKKV